MDTSAIERLLTGALLLAMPLILLISALPNAVQGAAAARRYRNRIRLAANTTLALSVLAAISFAMGSTGNLVAARLDIPMLHTPLAIAVQVDTLTLVLAVLVSFVIAIIAQYSAQYLDGDPYQARFSRLLAATAGLFLLVVISGDMGLFTLAIIATGFSLHRLLQFYPDRPRAVMATHKKSLFSRTADACLLVATMLVGNEVGSLQFDRIAHYATQADSLPLAMHLAAWLIVAAVILKSAQFPFHGWLIQVMEAPTPVSALMHAGVVYSGAIMVLRTNQLLGAEGMALNMLALVGLATLTVASLVMLTQTAVKSTLAWSTTAQLGFMLLELGLGLYALALLHLVGHSLYKAHAFLSSGSVVDQLRQIKPPATKPVSTGNWFAAVGTSVIITGLAARGLDLDLMAAPELIPLTAIVALAVSQLILKGLTLGSARTAITAGLVAATMALTYFALHELFMQTFADVMPTVPVQLSPGYAVLLALVVAAFATLTWLQGPGRHRLAPGHQSALFVHLYNGLYVDMWVERLSYRLWPNKVGRRSRNTGTLIARTPMATDQP